ncbi:MAG TPA: sigma-70 family RNA polymerase sigma factor [Acidobacteriota bacterium]|nr:sigma-70 family RNA polymerase sigma factor [Acidobacteriota bacterium]
MKKRERITSDRVRHIYRETVYELYAYVSRRTGGDRALAEDVVQESFLRGLRHWQKRGLPDSPIAWLKTVARNLIISHFRKTRPEPVEEWDGFPSDGDFRSRETAALVHWVLGRLRDEQASLLEAFHFEGKRVRELAGEMGISERAVEGRLRRARTAFKERLKAVSPRKGRS